MAHVEKRGKNSWRLVVNIGYDEKGTPIRERKTIQAKNRTEARKELALFEAEILTGRYIKPENITLDKVYAEWNEHVGENELSVRTKREYVQVYEKRLKSLYGHMKLADIMPIHVLNFVNSLTKDGARLDGKEGPLSTSSINNCYKAFSSILRFAEKMRWISENPAKDVKPPTPKHAETEIYEPNELAILASHLRKLEFRWEVLIAIALTSSARQGEIAALEERYVDFERGGIHVNQSLSVVEGGGVVLKSTKTKNSRFLSLPETIMNMIKKLILIRKQEILAAGDKREWSPHLFLFGNEFGKPIRPDSISQWWGRFMDSKEFKELELKRIRFHDLRHSSLTYLSARGIRPKAVQKRAGHTRIGTTFDIYGHMLIEEDKEAASHFDDLFTSEKPAEN